MRSYAALGEGVGFRGPLGADFMRTLGAAGHYEDGFVSVYFRASPFAIAKAMAEDADSRARDRRRWRFARRKEKREEGGGWFAMGDSCD